MKTYTSCLGAAVGLVWLGLASSASAATCPPDYDLGSAVGTDLNISLSLGAPTTTCGAINDFSASLGDTVTCAAGQPAEDISFVWTSPGTGAYVISTDGSTYDTALQVRSYVPGVDCGATQLACDDDGGIGLQSQITLQATAGQVYMIVVDGYNTNCGDWILSISCADSDGDGVCDDVDQCEGDDAFGDTDLDLTCDDIDPCPTIPGLDLDGDGVCDGIDLCFGDNATGDTDGDGICGNLDLCFGDDSTGDSDGDGTCNNLDSVCNNVFADLGSAIGLAVATGTTAGGGNTIYAACALNGNSTAEDLQFLWTAPASGEYTFDTAGSSYDTVLSVGTAADCGQTFLGCNDDSGGTLQSLVTVTLNTGDAVIINVDGYGTATGNFVLNISSNICIDDDGDGICNAVDQCFGTDASGDSDGDDLCDDLDVVLDVGAVQGHTPTDFVVFHSAWSGRVYIAATLDGAGAGPCLPLVGICTNLINPILVGGAPADPLGVTVVTRSAPTLSAGRRITFQAAVIDFAGRSGQTSNVVSRTTQ